MLLLKGPYTLGGPTFSTDSIDHLRIKKMLVPQMPLEIASEYSADALKAFTKMLNAFTHRMAIDTESSGKVSRHS